MSVVLIVEDDPDLLGAISDGLAEDGWTVLGAGSMARALELARTHQMDVVLSDLRLADGDGQALEHALRAGAVTVPVVFMTGLSLRGRDLGASTVIVKPFDMAEAAAALRRALSERRWASRRPPRPADRPVSAVESFERLSRGK